MVRFQKRVSLGFVFCLLGLVSGLISYSLPASADSHYYYLRRLQLISALRAHPTFNGGGTHGGIFQQRINPDDPQDKRTFAQRYWINSQFAKNQKSPVLYVICGEAPCEAETFLGAAQDHARIMGAHLVALEHRYYGSSQPFPSMTAENLKFLSTRNALIDLANFQDFVAAKLHLNGAWITIGGSYAGSLSAFYRSQFPQRAVGALSSSGPVHAKADFFEYDATVARVAGPQCAALMRKAVKVLESTLTQPAQLAKAKALFGASEVVDPVDFLYVVADMAAIAIQYGQRDYFCNELAKGPNEVTAYARAGVQMFQRFGITAVQDSLLQGASSTNPADYMSSFGMRAWIYQSCTEFGYWQIANPSAQNSVRSSLINLEYHNRVCQQLFGLPPVNTDRINQTLLKDLLTPQKSSQIFMTNGSTDPWSNLSITPSNQALNPRLDLFLINGGSHCSDLGSPSAGEPGSYGQARDIFLKLAQKWLNP